MPAPKIDIKVQNGLVQVRTPMNTYFVQRAKKLAGRWDPRSVAWVFDALGSDRSASAGDGGRLEGDLDDVAVQSEWPLF